MFFQTPWVYTTLLFALFVILSSVGLLFIYRKHKKWNYSLPIIICWSLMFIGEIGKQIYYKGAINRWPINYCGSFLFLIPLYFISKKFKWRVVNEVSASCNYAGTLAVLVVFFFYPKILLGSLPNNGVFWDNYQDFWGIVYHAMLSFIALWFLYHHTLKLKWIHLLYLEICVILYGTFMGLMSYLTGNSFGQMAEGVLPLGIGAHIWTMGLIYCVSAAISGIFWKYVIQNYVPDLLHYKNN